MRSKPILTLVTIVVAAVVAAAALRSGTDRTSVDIRPTVPSILAPIGARFDDAIDEVEIDGNRPKVRAPRFRTPEPAGKVLAWLFGLEMSDEGRTRPDLDGVMDALAAERAVVHSVRGDGFQCGICTGIPDGAPRAEVLMWTWSTSGASIEAPDLARLGRRVRARRFDASTIGAIADLPPTVAARSFVSGEPTLVATWCASERNRVDGYAVLGFGEGGKIEWFGP